MATKRQKQQTDMYTILVRPRLKTEMDGVDYQNPVQSR